MSTAITTPVTTQSLHTSSASSRDWERQPSFTGTPDQFDLLTTQLGTSLPLGLTRAGKTARLDILRPSPTRLIVIGQAWIASLLSLRAAALGAAVTICTERPASWAHLIQSAGGQQPFATLMRPDAIVLPPSAAAAPVLLVHDGGGPEAPPARAPWQSSLHLVFRLLPQVVSLIDSADVTLLPRPADDEIETTLQLLRLPSALAVQLARMSPVDVLAITRRRVFFVSVNATPTEQRLLTGS